MHSIGLRIKEHRKRNDLTQEKLADFLGVTHKAVSKWECGITTPDLALIGPLTKILHVSADELLGLTKESDDTRRAELDGNLRQAWIHGGEMDGFALVYKAQEAIAREYPTDLANLRDFAWTIFNRAQHAEDRDAEILRAIHHFETVIDTSDDWLLKASAIDGITRALAAVGCYDEARRYADLLPDPPRIDREKIYENVLRGEELRKHRQQRLDSVLHTLIVLMEQCARDKLQAIRHCEEILCILIPDGNYLEYHCYLAELAYRKAVYYMQMHMYEEAVSALQEYREHSIQADHADVHEEPLAYTSPYFDLLVLPANVPEERYTPSYTEASVLQMQNAVFDPLCDREDFRALFE